MTNFTEYDIVETQGPPKDAMAFPLACHPYLLVRIFVVKESIFALKIHFTSIVHVSTHMVQLISVFEASGEYRMKELKESV